MTVALFYVFEGKLILVQHNTAFYCHAIPHPATPDDAAAKKAVCSFYKHPSPLTAHQRMWYGQVWHTLSVIKCHFSRDGLNSQSFFKHRQQGMHYLFGHEIRRVLCLNYFGYLTHWQEPISDFQVFSSP